MYCSNCGTKISIGTKFCPSCGTPVAADVGTDRVVTADDQGNTVPQKKPAWIPVLIILALLALGALGALFASGSCSSNQAANSSSSQGMNSQTSSSGEEVPAEVAASSSGQEEPEPVVNPVQAYLPILQAYKLAAETGQAGNDCVNPEVISAQDWVGRPLSYGLVDVAGDDSPELVVAYKFDSGGNGSGTSGTLASYRLYDLYGLENSSPVRIVDPTSLGNRANYTLFQDGYLLREGSSGVMDVQTDYYRLAANSTVPELLESNHATVDGITVTDGNGAVKEALTEHDHFDISLIREDIEWHFVSEVAVDAADRLPVEGATEQVSGEVIDTGAYTITIPAEYAGNYDYRFETQEPQYGDGASGMGMAWTTTVVLGGSLGTTDGQMFSVSCFTDDWGVQGQYNIANLGAIPSMPGWHAVMYSPQGSPNGIDPNVYASWVTLK